LQPLTHRELLNLHAEIKAMQARLGISYKDASHRLYLAEWERIKVEDNAYKAFLALKEETAAAIKTFEQRLFDIEGPALEGDSMQL
jgi:hypothetical protein